MAKNERESVAIISVDSDFEKKIFEEGMGMI